MNLVIRDKHQAFIDFRMDGTPEWSRFERKAVSRYADLLDHVLDDVQQEGHWGRWESTAYMDYIETFVQEAKRYLQRFSALLPPIKEVYVQGEYAGTGICPAMEGWTEEPQLRISFGSSAQYDDVSIIIGQNSELHGKEFRALDEGLIYFHGEQTTWIIGGPQPKPDVGVFIVKDDKVQDATQELLWALNKLGIYVSAHDVAAFTLKEQENAVKGGLA